MSIQSLQLGSRIFPLNLIQGPLAGVSSAPFRKLITRYSQPAFTCTEMLSCKTLIHQSNDFLKRFTYKDPEEGALCFQLSGNHPYELSEAVKRVTAMGANLIDLNCGCPVKKIRSKRAGSQLLSEPGRLYQLMLAMKQHTHLPVSIKIRVDGASTDSYNHDIAKAVNDAGIDFLIVHGRHWSEHYGTACRYDDIAFFVNEVRKPVIGNGDVACTLSLQKMLKTGCAGVMVSRASVGQPWLIRQLVKELNGELFRAPSLTEKGLILIEHASSLASLFDNEMFALLHTRKFAKYYARELSTKYEFCDAVNCCENLDHFYSIVRVHFIDSSKASTI